VGDWKGWKIIFFLNWAGKQYYFQTDREAGKVGISTFEIL